VEPPAESDDNDPMRARRPERATNEAGYTLTELLIVMVVIAILIAIAIPSYLGYRDRAIRATASSNLRQAIPAAETYYGENGSYLGMTRAGLLALNVGLAPNVQVAAATATTYCLSDTIAGRSFSIPGPGASVADIAPNATCS
jgi:type IV pilus assembly protein PilA